ncbi:XdhC family protein [Luteimonas deserti]|nr:XdhC/CoxI family protein [Luteimonas deserti]
MAWMPAAATLSVPVPAPIHAVIAAACHALETGAAATLVVVVETDGSTYAQPGGLALFGPGAARTGWLSGGCLEPAIARRAAHSADTGTLGWMEVDTRDDAALLSGSALGCRGRLRLALLPLREMPGLAIPLHAWIAGGGAAHWTIARDGGVALAVDQVRRAWRMPAGPVGWDGASAWTPRIDAPAHVLLCGGGPETPLLAPLLRDLGWRLTLAERRSAWTTLGALVHRLVPDPAAALAGAPCVDAALVMHHNFELDLEALAALAPAQVPFVGLLGPVRRRDDLFRVLAPDVRTALQGRLHAPVGLDLGGRGAEAIALSIAAQLQAWRHGRPT